MASPAPVSLPSTVSSRFPIFRGQQWQLYRGSAVCAWNSRTSVTCCVRPPTMALFREPPKIMVHLNNFRERLWEVVPRSVKDFPWKKTEDILLQQSLLVGREALKWLLLLLYVCSSVSDVIYSISRNKELTIPFGLFVGCMVANFLVDTSQELFPISQERSVHWHLCRIGGFLALAKIMLSYYKVQGGMFLLHAANGGLMQILWLWRNSTEKQDMDTGDYTLQQDSSVAQMLDD
ncbi:uncharacterized protein LOC127808378 isoform X1 [Diospyros lotus]|uniref:uncharacterized protein LOC127808378 isoform X1 n=1 Tax=Diospyros lotus TaxID=55363 RepID=UPI002252C465|nr:uncharacterized protein LOC127808378 isoform X1 [Diospyros lotus]